MDKIRPLEQLCFSLIEQPNAPIKKNQEVNEGGEEEKRPNIEQETISSSQMSTLATSDGAQDETAAAAAKSMAAVTRKLIKRTRPLRQINVVGQLNHSARQGLLLLMTQPLACLMLLLCVFTVDASIWPFANTGARTFWPHHSPATHRSVATNSTTANKRVAPATGTVQVSSASQAAAAASPISQQFHYFWNHDQIEPQVVATEANKILSHAQAQTDQKLLSSSSISSDKSKQRRSADSSLLDPLMVAASASAEAGSETMQSSDSSPAGEYQQQPIVIPAAIQQQLTSMVLNMQRQQQMSTMMQPRFEQPRPVVMPPQFAQRRSISPVASAGAPLWMQASEQAPAFLPMARPAPPTGQANIAGVPVYGPFMVAPSPSIQAAAARAAFVQQHQHQHQQQQHQSLTAKQQQVMPSTRSSGTRSFLGSRTGRKNWPIIFGGFHSLGGGQASNHQAGAASHLHVAASHVKPTIVSPTQQIQQPTAATVAATDLLPPESMALLEMASNQLVAAIAGQMQARAAQHRLAAAFSQALDNPDFMQAAASTLGGDSSAAKFVAPKHQTTGSMLPPYQLMSAQQQQQVIAIPPNTAAAARALAMNLGANPVQAMQSLEILKSLLAEASNGTAPSMAPLSSHGLLLALGDVPFGSRLRRRHLSPTPAGSSSLEQAKRAKLSPVSRKKSPVASGATNATTLERRIVKKGSADPMLSARPYQPAAGERIFDDEAKRRARAMFQEPGDAKQVRRLKRSALLFTSDNSMSSGSASGAKGWVASDNQQADRALKRRQAEISFSSSSSATLLASTPKPEAVAEQKTSGERQEKSLKIKRIIGNVSAFHHPMPSTPKPPPPATVATSRRRSTVISGAPALLIGSGREESKDLVDPMVSALAESTRVTNYFQNVDNESTKPPASAPPTSKPEQQLQQTTASSPSSSSSSLPKINLAFSAPSKLGSSDNLQTATTSPMGEARRATTTSGNGSQAAGGRGSPTDSMQQPQLRFVAANQQQQQQKTRTAPARQQSPAGVGSADISSAATGHNQVQHASGYGSAQSNAGSSSSSSMVVAPPQQQSYLKQAPQSSQSGLIVGPSATNMANYARSSSQLSPMLSTTALQTAFDGRPLRDISYGATSFNRQLVVAPGSKMSSSVSMDRNTSADQSNSYNDEMPPPPPSGGYQQDQETGSGPQMMNNEAEAANQHQHQQMMMDAQQQSQQYNSMEQVSAMPQNEQPTVDPVSGQSMMNLAPADGYGQRNHQQQPDNSAAVMQQAYQSAAEAQQGPFNGQQLPMGSAGDGSMAGTVSPTDAGAFNQVDETTSGLYGGQQQQQQYLSTTTPVTTLASQQQQHQQLYTQQMRALGAVVSNFNQQRLNQQLQAASYNPSSSRAFFNPASQYQQNQFGAGFQPIDEDAAAGTLAAQGIATLPNAAQLMAMQSNQALQALNDMSSGPDGVGHHYGGSLMMSGSEKRSERQSDGEEETRGVSNKKSNKKNKNKGKHPGGPKQVSHHYHFNNLGSPFEDPNHEFGGLNPLDIAGQVQGNENGYVGKPIRQNKVKQVKGDDEEKGEEEKPKKKASLLRRFSFKNLFKRFRKDKKKENEQEEEEQDNNSTKGNNENENNANENNEGSSQDRR